MRLVTIALLCGVMVSLGCAAHRQSSVSIYRLAEESGPMAGPVRPIALQRIDRERIAIYALVQLDGDCVEDLLHGLSRYARTEPAAILQIRSTHEIQALPYSEIDTSAPARINWPLLPLLDLGGGQWVIPILFRVDEDLAAGEQLSGSLDFGPIARNERCGSATKALAQPVRWSLGLMNGPVHFDRRDLAKGSFWWDTRSGR